MDTLSYSTINYILSYYSLLVASFGTLGNLITIFICTRKALRETTTFIFIAFMSFVETISLYEWNLNAYFLTYFKFNITDFNLATCRALSVLQMFSLQCSAFFLVNFCVNLFTSVKTFFKLQYRLQYH